MALVFWSTFDDRMKDPILWTRAILKRLKNLNPYHKFPKMSAPKIDKISVLNLTVPM